MVPLQKKQSRIPIAVMLIMTLIAAMQAMAQNVWQQRYSVLVGGIEIQETDGSWVTGCTIGFPAYYESGGSRTYGVVTAGHCSYWFTGWSVYQPTIDPINLNYIGSVSRVNSYSISGSVGDIPIALMRVDA